jgi:hypothetical protein
MGARLRTGGGTRKHGLAGRHRGAMMARMAPDDPEPGNLIERNPDGTFTKETLARAMKALKKRMKLTRLDDESKLGHDPMSRGGRSGVVAVRPPQQYPPEVWQALEAKGRIRGDRHGLYEILEQPSNPSGS